MAAFIIFIAVLALLWIWLQRRKPQRSSDDFILSNDAYDHHSNGPAIAAHDSSVVSGAGGDFGGAGASGSWDSGGGDSGGGDGGGGD